MLQIWGHVFNLGWLKGIGVLTVASPLPIVFTEVKGIETFAQDFYLSYSDSSGHEKKIKITPEIYKNLDGPYNFRNVIGAAIAYGPIIPQEMTQSVLNFVLINPGKLVEILNINEEINNPKIVIKSRTEGRNQIWVLSPSEKK